MQCEIFLQLDIELSFELVVSTINFFVLYIKVRQKIKQPFLLLITMKKFHLGTANSAHNIQSPMRTDFLQEKLLIPLIPIKVTLFSMIKYIFGSLSKEPFPAPFLSFIVRNT